MLVAKYLDGIYFVAVMNILLDDIIFDLQKSGGISVYWQEVTKRVISDQSNNVRKLKTGESRFLPFSLGRFLPVLANPFKDEPFIFHSSYYRINKDPRAKNVVTVHDFTHRRLGRGIKNSLFIAQQSYAIKNAARIICVSESTKRDLRQFFPNVNPDKVHVIHHGVSDIFLHRPATSENIKTEQPYALFVGSRASYKNFDKAVLALADLNLKLVIAGASPLSEVEVSLLNSSLINRWEFIQHPSAETLANLYSKATCLLYPSSYEGFGIPIVEAAACGAPVIACNNSSIPEVAGPSTLLLETPTVELLSEAISRISAGYWRPDLAAGARHAAGFSWDRCYAETMKTYEAALVN